MPTISNAFKTGALDGGLARLNQGSPDANGDLEFLTSADVSLAVLALNATAFQPASINGANAQATANAISPAAGPNAGTIGKAKLRDRGNAAVLTFTVSLLGGGGEIIFGDVVIPPGATSVSCSAFIVSASFA